MLSKKVNTIVIYSHATDVDPSPSSVLMKDLTIDYLFRKLRGKFLTAIMQINAQ